jgi:DNA-binding MarR family transcriptional regulator
MKNDHIQHVREFSRFYTNVIGLLDQHLLDSPYSLPEARILYELGQRDTCTASDLMAELTMDRGYMSRIITRFMKRGLISRKRSAEDGRAYFLSLTPKGKKAFDSLDQASTEQVKILLKPMDERTREKLLGHMREISSLINKHHSNTPDL